MPKELTLNDLSNDVESLSRSVSTLSNDVRDVMTAVHELATNVDVRFEKVEGELKKVRSEMVTKEYLDDKLTDLRGDLIVLARRGNQKLSELISDLVHRGSLSHEAAKRILALEPFPQA